MPPVKVKVCLWNIQNYGSGSPDLRWGANSTLRNRFIRDLVRAEEVDVLMVMEASTKSSASITDLVATLNQGLDGDADWAGCLCGSAMTEDSSDPPASADDLTFQSDARSEGFAVFWRTRQAGRFSMVSALNPIARLVQPPPGVGVGAVASPVNLSTRGRPEVERVLLGKRRRGGPAVAGYLPTQLFPYAANGTVMDHWPVLTMPTTGRLNPAERALAGARRPAYVVLKLNLPAPATHADRLVPVVAYHAPSNRGQAETGSTLAGMIRELYVTNDVGDGTVAPLAATLLHPARAVAGGDFNYSVSSREWPKGYRYFVQAFAQDADGGANCHHAPSYNMADAARRTTVRLTDSERAGGLPITSANPNEYLALKIDLAFFRGPNTSAERVNVLNRLLDPNTGAPYRATLQAFHAHLAALVANLDPARKQYLTVKGPWQQKTVKRKGHKATVQTPMISGGWGATFVNWPAFLAQLQAGQLTAARQAAEFYRMFVSDHLPLTVTLEF